MLHRTYEVDIRREVFQGADSWVAYDNAGHWRAHCAAHFANNAEEAVGMMFHACEVRQCWTDGAETKANILS